MIRILTIFLAGLLFSGGAQAATIYSELVSGDATDFLQPGPGGTTDLGALAPLGSYSISGLVIGGSDPLLDTSLRPDPFDNYQFQVAADFTVDVTDDGVGTLLALYKQVPYQNSFVFSRVLPAGQLDPLLPSGADVFAAAGILGPGIYAIGLRPGGHSATGTSAYQITIATGPSSIIVVLPPMGSTPLPASFFPLMGALAGLGLLRRRSRRG